MKDSAPQQTQTQAQDQIQSQAILDKYLPKLSSTRESTTPRYNCDGGFNVVFDIGHDIVIEFVGKGFDGHELARGIAVHESYVIPWDDVLAIEHRTDLIKHRHIKRFIVSEDGYRMQCVVRVKFLTHDCGYDADAVLRAIPTSYHVLSSSLVDDFLKDVVLELFGQTDRLLVDQLYHFGVQGNFVDGKAQPWKIFQKDHWR